MGKILKYWPKEEIIKALQKLPKDKPINKKTIIEYSKQGLICNSSLIPTKFGSLKYACYKAGVRCDALYGKEKMAHMANLNTKYTKEKLLEIVKENFIDSNSTLTNFVLKHNKENNVDIRGAIKKHFGTYKNLFKEAEIKYRDYYWTNKRIITTLKKLNKEYGPLMKIDINKFRKKRLLCGSKLIKDRFGSVANAAKLAGFEFVEPQDINHEFNGKIGKRETNELDLIEMTKNIKLLRQYRIKTKNNFYFLDGYDKKNNIAYEIDGHTHEYDNEVKKDKIRENNIKNEINCEFIRIKIF